MNTWCDVEKMERVRLFLEEKLDCQVVGNTGNNEKTFSYIFTADGGKLGTLEIVRATHDDNDFKSLLVKIEIQKVLARMKGKKEKVVLI